MKKFLFLFLFFSTFSVVYGESLFIVTTDEIREKSTMLDTFVRYKKAMNYEISVVSEKDFGGADKVGIEKALILRDYLKSLTVKPDFVLFIGNPNSDSGDIPMMKMWPLHMFPEDESGPYPSNEPVDTDFFYKDLSSNWDCDGDGVYGETNDDSGAGCMEFNHDITVGRIPVYDNNIDELDKVLSGTVEYMKESDANISYRKKILFPAGFYFFRGMPTTDSKDWDSAGLGEWAVTTFFDDFPSFTYTRMYEEEGVVTSSFDSDVPLNHDNLVDEWKKGQGIIFWGGHTLRNLIMRSVWREDSNNDGLSSMSELSMPDLLTVSDIPSFDDSSRSFVLAPNCSAGDVSKKGNLTHALLVYESVGVVSASIAASRSGMNWSCYTCKFEDFPFGSDTAGIYALKALMNGDKPSIALVEAESLVDRGKEDGLSASNKMMFNYFGDPTLSLDTKNIEISDDIEEPDEDIDVISTDEDIVSKGSSSSGCSMTLF